MKHKLKLLAFIFFACNETHCLQAQGYIVPNGVTYAGTGFGLGAEIHVLQNPTTSDYTGFFLTPQSTTSFLFNPFLDEGVRTFLVSPNNPVSLQAILTSGYPELTYPHTYVFGEGVPFYLGFYTGYNPWDSHGQYTGIYTDPVFAWGRFVNSGGVIQLLDGALEYGGGGIYADTQIIIAVPEPSFVALAVLGAAGLILRSWRQTVFKSN